MRPLKPSPKSCVDDWLEALDMVFHHGPDAAQPFQQESC